MNSSGTSSSVFPSEDELYYLEDPFLIVLPSTTPLFCSLMFCRQKNTVMRISYLPLHLSTDYKSIRKRRPLKCVKCCLGKYMTESLSSRRVHKKEQRKPKKPIKTFTCTNCISWHHYIYH